MANKGLHASPGDRGDSSNTAGVNAIKSGGNKGALKSECSKGYDAVNTGWAGNVKR